LVAVFAGSRALLVAVGAYLSLLSLVCLAAGSLRRVAIIAAMAKSRLPGARTIAYATLGASGSATVLFANAQLSFASSLTRRPRLSHGNATFRARRCRSA
jgi:hypothetical protein